MINLSEQKVAKSLNLVKKFGRTFYGSITLPKSLIFKFTNDRIEFREEALELMEGFDSNLFYIEDNNLYLKNKDINFSVSYSYGENGDVLVNFSLREFSWHLEVIESPIRRRVRKVE